MGRARLCTFSLTLLAAGCSPEPRLPAKAPLATPDPVAAKPVPSADPIGPPAPPTPPPPKLAVATTFGAAPLGDEDGSFDRAPLAAALEGQKSQMLSCLAGAEQAPGSAWFVFRVGVSGRVEMVNAASAAGPSERTACLQQALQKVVIAAPSSPLAVSYALRFGPEAPKGSPVVSSGLVSAMSEGGLGSSAGSRDLGDRQDDPKAFGGLIGRSDTSFGAGGLGLRGTGLGGGGAGAGLGLGGLGTLGHGSGTGSSAGLGSRDGKLGGADRAHPPKIRMSSPTVDGLLPREVIQRIVRQNFGRFRRCYEAGLARDPSLAGRVTTRFIIGLDGAVTSVNDDKSDLADKTVVACVVKSFATLSFPQPEGGVVIVTYPIVFSPSDDAPKAKPKPGGFAKVGGIRFRDLDAATIVSHAGSAAASVQGESAKPPVPFVVFVPVDQEVYSVRRIKASQTSAKAHSDRIERTSDGWSLVVDGPDRQSALDLIEKLVDR